MTFLTFFPPMELNEFLSYSYYGIQLYCGNLNKDGTTYELIIKFGI